MSRPSPEDRLQQLEEELMELEIKRSGLEWHYYIAKRRFRIALRRMFRSESAL